MSIVCEAFGCLPSEAVRELESNGALVGEIMDLRAFAAAHRAIKDMKPGHDAPPDTPHVRAVLDFLAEELRGFQDGHRHSTGSPGPPE